MKRMLCLLPVVLAFGMAVPTEKSEIIRKIHDVALTEGRAYENLRMLCKDVGHRLTGSHGDTAAVIWAQRMMAVMGFENIKLQPFEADLWLRGSDATGVITYTGGRKKMVLLALGSSVGTGEEGITGGVVEVNSWDEMKAMDPAELKGKIVFYNRPMDPKNINTFVSYGQTADQRHKGASEASKHGAVAALVRSVTMSGDEHPHTGNMSYEEGVEPIPGLAVSAKDADALHALLAEDVDLKLTVKSDCKMAGKVISNNVMGEIKGSEFPEKVIVVGAHLDSWDVGDGAHDDGAGVVHAMEVLHIFKKIGYKPRHTIRCVLYMNEENGVAGGIEYARVAKEKGEVHVAAIESDAGGFSPRGYHADGVNGRGEFGHEKLLSWKGLLEPYNLHYFKKAYAGTDIGPLRHEGTVIFGLVPDSQRYFDFHHTAADVFEAVHKRELELGAASMATLAYLIDQDGL